MNRAKRNTIERRPAGTTAAVASVLVAIAAWLGLELSVETAALIIGALTALVSHLTPRPARG